MKKLSTKLVLYSFIFATSQAAWADGDYRSEQSYQGSGDPVPFARITYEQNSSALSESARAVIRNVILHEQDPNARVTIAAWSDRALPAPSHLLSGDDLRLADARANAMAEYVAEIWKPANMAMYNMAENSNTLAQTFHTPESELSSEFAKRGAEFPVTDHELQVIKRVGGPSVAIMTIERAGLSGGIAPPYRAPVVRLPKKTD